MFAKLSIHIGVRRTDVFYSKDLICVQQNFQNYLVQREIPVLSKE